MPYYTNPYQQSYAQFQPQMQPQSQAQPQQVQQPLFQSNNGINWVQGEAGAKAYPVGANNSVLLMDSEGQYFYIKSADQVGMPMMKKFAYSEIVEEPMRIESHDAPVTSPQINTDNLATKDDIKNLEQKITELGNIQNMREHNNQQNKNGGQKNG